MKIILRMLLLAVTLSLANVTSFATTNLILNGDFELGRTNWNFQNSFFIFTNSASALSPTRYAYVGADSSGSPANTIGGEMYQQFTIPSNATSVICTWWYYITSTDTGGVANDTLISCLKTTSGAVRAYLQTNSNLDRVTTKTYKQSTSWQLNILTNETLRLSFYGTNNSSSPTVFRIDDVSIIATVPPRPFTMSADPSCYMSGTTRTPEVILSWDSSTGATSYNIYRNGSYYDTAYSTYYENTNVTIGSTYTYYIVAVNSDGTRYSNTNTVKVPANVCPQPPTPATPGGTSAPGTLISTLTPTFIWNELTGATGYGVYASVFPYGEANQIYATNLFTPVTSNTIPAGILITNTSYRWKVTSFYGDIESDPSVALYFTTPTTPNAPSELSAVVTNSGITIGWRDNSSDETGFIIERRRVSNGVITSFTVAANQTNYLDTSPAQSIQYCYTVRATSGAGDSIKTSEQCATYVLPGAAPNAIISGDYTPVTGKTTYFGNYSTGTGTLSYSWSTSDGQQSNVQNPQFAFNSPGAYTIYLMVTDTYQRTGTASISINVQASNNGGTSRQTLGADPVVLSSGNYIQQHTDLRLPGKGLPFEFSRFYNSKFSDQSGKPLGYGWTHNYNQNIQDTGSNVLVVQGDGSTWTFFPTNGGYIGEPGVFDSLAHNPDGTWSLTNKSQTVMQFNTVGQLSSIIDKNNNTITLTYTNGILRRIQDTGGRIILLNTNANSYGRISDITDPIGRTIRFLYDSSTNLTSVVDANSQTNNFQYNANHQLTDGFDAKGTCFIHNDYDPNNFTVIRQRDAYLNWNYFTYDFSNRVTWLTNSLGKFSIHYFDDHLLETNAVDEMGNHQVFAYDTNRNRVFVQDKNGNQTHYGYDAFGNATNKTDALLNVSAIYYNSLNNPIKRVDSLLNTTTFGYDVRGNLISTTNALGFISRVQYDISGLPTILTDARGNSITNQYDQQGNLIASTDANGATTHLDYDIVGRKIRQIDALNHTNSFYYDNNDNLLYTVDALGFTNRSTYDANNNRTSTRNPRNAITTNIFDLKDRLILVTDALTNTFYNYFDVLDRKISAVDGRNNTTYFSYDDVGNLIKTTNALGKVIRFTFDPQGNQTSVIDPDNNRITSFYDALNRRTVTIDALNHTNSTVYDSLGRIAATTNANCQVTQFFYDKIGRLTNVLDAVGKSVLFDYDQNGNRIRITDANYHSWTNVFDEMNRLVEQDDPQGNKTIFHYDLLGNLTNKVTANGDSIIYCYDALNRFTNIVYPTGPPITYTYDSVGNRTNMTDANGATVWQYDLLNRLTKVTDPYGQPIVNEYDQNGNRVSLIYPGNKVVHYGFDALNRMTSFTNWLNGTVVYVYDNRGNLITANNANGTVALYGYDNGNRLITLTNIHADASVIANYAVTLDALGNHMQATHNQPLFPILLNQTNNYTYNSDNRLVTIDNQTVTHNANGDLTSIGTNSFVYDFDDRLIQLTLTNTLATFAYDGLGNRLTSTVNGKVRHYVFDRSRALTQVLVENATNNVPVAFYVYGIGLAERITLDGQITTYHFNIQGSTIALTDSGANITVSYAYDTFGVLSNSEGDSPQPYRFLGRYGIFDDSGGLLYARARYFSPQLGRFLTKDPVMAKDYDNQGLNRYCYALNNPLRFVDPSGLTAHEGQFQNSSYAADAAYWDAYNESASWMIPYLKALKYAGDAAQIALAFVSDGGSATITSTIERTAPKVIGSTGGVGENFLKLFGGESQVYFKTSQGGRYIDQLVNSVAHESKVGYQSLTANISRQISKDVELIQSGQIQSASWHFFRSPVTERVGLSQPLLEALQKWEINVIVH